MTNNLWMREQLKTIKTFEEHSMTKHSWLRWWQYTLFGYNIGKDNELFWGDRGEDNTLFQEDRG